MADLTADQFELASDLVFDVQDRLAGLEAGNERAQSGIRDDLISDGKDLLKAIDDAVRSNDAAKLEAFDKELEWYGSLIASLQDNALMLWATQYAAFIEALRDVVDERDSPETRIIRGALAVVWSRSPFKKKKIPREVRELYAYHLLRRVDGFLSFQAIRFRALKEFGVANRHDVPMVLLQIPREQIGMTAARLAVKDYDLKNTELPTDEPAVIDRIWNVVGWDSFSDFAFDMGLIVVTGGGAAFVRWGAKIAKGVRNARRIGKTGRYLKLTKQYQEEVKAVEEALGRIRSRLGSPATKRGKPLSPSHRRVARYFGEVIDKYFKYASQFARSKREKEELLSAVKDAWKLANGLAQSLTAEQLNRAVFDADRTPKGWRDIASSNIAQASAKLGINSRTGLERKIENARDAFVRGLLTGAGKPQRLFAKWYLWLIVRQVAIRGTVLIVRKRDKIRPGRDLLDLLQKCMLSAFEETLLDAKLPSGQVSAVTAGLTKVVRKMVQGIVSQLVAPGSSRQSPVD